MDYRKEYDEFMNLPEFPPLIIPQTIADIIKDANNHLAYSQILAIGRTPKQILLLKYLAKMAFEEATKIAKYHYYPTSAMMLFEISYTIKTYLEKFDDIDCLEVSWVKSKDNLCFNTAGVSSLYAAYNFSKQIVQDTIDELDFWVKPDEYEGTSINDANFEEWARHVQEETLDIIEKDDWPLSRINQERDRILCNIDTEYMEGRLCKYINRFWP